MPDIGLLQALMSQAQQVMHQAQPSEQGGFGQDQNGLDFLDNMLAQEKPEFRELESEIAFAAVQVPLEYQQNLVTNFERPALESRAQSSSPTLILPEAETTTTPDQQQIEQVISESTPEALLASTAQQNTRSIFIPGINGEVMLADESVTPDFIDPIGDVSSSQKEQDGYVDYVQPNGSVTSDPFQELNTNSQATIRNDGTLEVIENEDGVQDFTPAQEGVSFDPETGFDNNSSGGTLDLSTPSSESRAPEMEKQKESTFVAELQNEGSIETAPSINVEAKVGDIKLEGTLKAETTQRPQVMDQIFTKMDFPSLKQKGEQKISIVLDPQELGRVDVELQIDGDKVNAVFKADQQALNYAKDDAHKLLQMLKDQGFNASAQDFQFQERPSQEAHYVQANFAYGNFSVEEADTSTPQQLTQHSYNRSVSGSSYDAVI